MSSRFNMFNVRTKSKTKNLITNNKLFTLFTTWIFIYIFFLILILYLFLYLPTYFLLKRCNLGKLLNRNIGQTNGVSLGWDYCICLADQWQLWKPVRKRSLFLHKKKKTVHQMFDVWSPAMMGKMLDQWDFTLGGGYPVQRCRNRNQSIKTKTLKKDFYCLSCHVAYGATDANVHLHKRACAFLKS